MAVHHGPDGPDPSIAAVVDDAAATLLSVWDDAREAASTRVSGSQLAALLVVERAEGLNLRALAAQLRMILSSASRLCDRLTAAGLLEREPGRVDRREIALYLTPAGAALLQELRTARRRRLARMMEQMAPAGRAALVRGLADFATAAKAAEADDRANSA